MNNSFTDKRSPLSRRQGGFALIELMIGVLIVSISVVALYEMIVQGNTMLTFQRHKRIALEKAQGHMELLQYWAVKADSVPRRFQGDYREVMVEGSMNEGAQKEITGFYHIAITPSQYADHGIPYYSDVSIDYKWQEPLDDNEKEIVLKSRF